MGAPIGNQFWKMRSVHGREQLFATPELMWEAACEYFQWCEENPIQDTRSFGGKQKVQRPFTMHGLCRFLGCNTVYFNHFETSIDKKEDESSKDFSKVIIDIREAIYQQKFEHAAIGIFKDNIIARDLGLSEKTENRIQVEQPIFNDEDLPND